MMTNFTQPARPTTYRSFLIRLWCDAHEGKWYASAQLVQSRDVMRFATLQALFTYLEADTIDTIRSLDDGTATPDANDDAETNADE